MDLDEKIPLPHVMPAVGKQYGVTTPKNGYPRVYRAVLDGRLPAEVENGRYFIRRRHLPIAAEIVGLVVPVAA